MKKTSCENCYSEIGKNDSTCANCYFPNTDDVQIKSRFRMKLVDVKFWLMDLTSARAFMKRAATIYLIIGALLAFFLFDSFLFGAIGLMMIGGVYIALLFWSKTNQYEVYLAVLGFYYTHTVVELFLNIPPWEKIPLRVQDGWIGAIPILLSFLPILYPLARLALGSGLVKSFLSARKIRKNEKNVKSYVLSQSINKGKIIESTGNSMLEMFLKNYLK